MGGDGSALLIGAALAFFRKGRDKVGTWTRFRISIMPTATAGSMYYDKTFKWKRLKMYSDTSGGRCDR